ncbi:MAG: BMP family ABC transporter substrate-binding protein [Micrococcales bacterium]
MRFGALRFAAAVAAASSMLAGCAQVVSSATPTPVNFKACLISSPAGFADSGVNAQSRYGLMQSLAQFGESISAVELASGDGDAAVRRAGRKLVARGCGLIIGVGAASATSLIPLANGNPRVRFAILGFEGKVGGGEVSGTNLDAITFNSKLALIQAGYLAAARSSSAVVGVIARAGVAGVRQQIWYFRQGVEIFNQQAGASVRVKNAEGANPRQWNYLPAGAGDDRLALLTQSTIDAGADVIMPLGVEGSSVASMAASAKRYVIGTDSDWANETAFSTMKNTVLASIFRPVSQTVIDEVQRSMGGAVASPTPVAADSISQYEYNATLTPEASVSWGDGVAGEVDKLAQEFAAGTLVYAEFPG